MQKVKISSNLLNSDGETTNIETTGEFDKENNVITYNENDLKVRLEMFSNKVIISRKNNEYDLKLEFQKNEKKECTYMVKSIGLELTVEVVTNELEITSNSVHLKYELYNEHQIVGKFEYKLIFEE